MVRGYPRGVYGTVKLSHEILRGFARDLRERITLVEAFEPNVNLENSWSQLYWQFSLYESDAKTLISISLVRKARSETPQKDSFTSVADSTIKTPNIDELPIGKFSTSGSITSELIDGSIVQYEKNISYVSFFGEAPMTFNIILSELGAVLSDSTCINSIFMESSNTFLNDRSHPVGLFNPALMRKIRTRDALAKQGIHLRDTINDVEIQRESSFDYQIEPRSLPKPIKKDTLLKGTLIGGISVMMGQALATQHIEPSTILFSMGFGIALVPLTLLLPKKWQTKIISHQFKTGVSTSIIAGSGCLAILKLLGQ